MSLSLRITNSYFGNTLVAASQSARSYRTHMWIVELGFTEEPERLAGRAAHRQRLSALHRTGVVRMAGPFTDGSGALIIVDLPNREAVDSLVAGDPYFTTPGVRVHRVQQWQPFLR